MIESYEIHFSLCSSSLLKAKDRKSAVNTLNCSIHIILGAPVHSDFPNVFHQMWEVVKSVYLCIVLRLQFGRTPIVCTVVVNTNFVNANSPVLTRFQTYSLAFPNCGFNPLPDKCNELCKDRELDRKLYESAKKLTSARKGGTFWSSMKSWNWTWNRWKPPKRSLQLTQSLDWLSLHLSG